MSRRKRARTPTPGHYLGLKSTRDSGYRGGGGAGGGGTGGGDRGRYRGGSFRGDDYGYRRSPRRSPYRGAREYSPRHSPPPYGGGGRSRRDISRSPPPPPYSPPYGSPDRRYTRGSRPPNRVRSVSSSHSSYSIQPDELEDFVIGDCVIFEEGVFDDSYVSDNSNADHSSASTAKSNPKNGVVEINPENLVPDAWKEVQAEINITKKERRKIAQELQFGTRVEKRKKGLVPLRSVNLEEYLSYKEAKLAQLKPLVLDTPSSFPATEEVNAAEGIREVKRGEMSGSNERVAPKNPKWEVYGRGLEDVSKFFKSGQYQPDDRKSEGPRKLFSKEEKVMLNKRVPDLAAAHSDMWLPLHTLVGSGEFYLVDELLKNNVDVNAVDKVGFTALHRAIIGKKQAITNYLLRESANPFVRDQDQATLMHYAVQTASSQAIKVLLLYNVDINLQDKDGWTPLHLAVQARRTDVVRLLLIKGADKTLKNAEGLTPLDLCLYSGQDTKTYLLIKLLKQLPRPSKLPL